MARYNNPVPKYDDNDDVALSGGQLFFYENGTTTKKATYPTQADADAGTNANDNPMDLNSRGEPSVDIFFNGKATVTLASSTDTDPPASPLWSRDNVTSDFNNFSTRTVTSSSYTIVQADDQGLIVCDCTSNAITVSLPALATITQGFSFVLIKTDNTSNAVTIDASGSETIGASLTRTLTKRGDALKITATTSQWLIDANSLLDRYDSLGNLIVSYVGGASVVNYITETAATTTNSPSIAATGSDTNIALTVKGKGTGSVKLGQATSTGVQLVADQPLLDSNGNEVIGVTATSSAVNYVNVTNSATGNGVVIAGVGDDTNVGITLKGKGTGSVVLGQATSTGVQLAADQPILDSSGNELIKFTKAAAAVNELTIANGATGNSVAISATGGDTNIGLQILPKGSGDIYLSALNASSPALASQTEAEGASSTTKVITAGIQKYHPGTAKAWVYITYSGGTPSATASYNVTSITDTATGQATVNLTTSFSSTSYAVVSAQANNGSPLVQTLATGSFLVRARTTGFSDADENSYSVAFGDQ